MGLSFAGENRMTRHQAKKSPQVSTLRGAIKLANNLTEFDDWRNKEELSLAVTRVNDLLCVLQLKNSKQVTLDSYFTKQ